MENNICRAGIGGRIAGYLAADAERQPISGICPSDASIRPVDDFSLVRLPQSMYFIS